MTRMVKTTKIKEIEINIQYISSWIKFQNIESLIVVHVPLFLLVTMESSTKLLTVHRNQYTTVWLEISPVNMIP